MTTTTIEMKTTPVKLVMDEPINKVFIGNLPFKIKKESLVTFAETCGKILEVIVIKRYRRPFVFGFITFETEQEAKRAAKELNKKELEGHEVHVEIARSNSPHKVTRKRSTKKSAKKQKSTSTSSKEENTESNQESVLDVVEKKRRKRHSKKVEHSSVVIFIANLPFATNEQELKELFIDYKVVSVHVVRTKNGRSRGYGFVEFENEEETKKVLENVKDVVLEDRFIYIKPSLASQVKSKEASIKERGQKAEEKIKEDPVKNDSEKIKNVVKKDNTMKDDVEKDKMKQVEQEKEGKN
ncbi:hypothetical protein G6F57_001405 [Rhizopus arrhizus]|uniref:RRM domain-containing protein n=1 Tax=Rhizopus oryzae TaxID=64495 RepID=A0A9P6X898_RHIOR|nr:hypothetical protein G6F23_006027 [Rhizopus arrhizus]KAG1413724.1 hypothetical protein G6F58_007322 [Rhizopus delemar]KAG0796187.1 hypothetical protein G6F21_001515 [Rhizopus arrhizus]KAG0818165.1 hypothetical protein G6F20_001786 [Rhizopus arrhizus]KAG0840223.1 hypothetical protein G6F19_002161 [Rhizopus arrhizus]